MTGKTNNSEVIIYPLKGKNEPAVGRDALMVMNSSTLSYLAKAVNAKDMLFNDKSLYHLYQTGDDAKRPVTIAGPFLGAPHAVIGMEKLIALGAKRIWILGWCGSLQSDLHVGDIIIPTEAISEEGTSGHYPVHDRAIESDKKLNRMLENTLRQRGLSFVKGFVWTTDAVYRETYDKLRTYSSQGVLAVEMELSALITLAVYRSVAMAGLLVVSDELSDLKWRPGFSNPLLKKNTHLAGNILLDLIRSKSNG